MNNDFSLFAIEIKNKSDADEIIECLKKPLNIDKIHECDSSSYLMDTYWMADQGFWKIRFFYTDCSGSKNRKIRDGRIYYGVSIDSPCLEQESVNCISKYILDLIQKKFAVIVDDDIWPDPSDATNQFLCSFLNGEKSQTS